MSELAWAAGLFDGEGSVFPSRTKNRTGYVRLNMALAMVDRDVVQRFADAINIGVVKELNRKTTTGKTVFRWQTQTEATVKGTLRLLRPFLSVPKKMSALDALAEREIYNKTKAVTYSEAAKKRWEVRRGAHSS